MTTTEFATGRDVIAYLVQQHGQIKDLFQQVSDSIGEQRRDAFTSLRRLRAVHETAEEEIVHPARARDSARRRAAMLDRARDLLTGKAG